MKNILQISRLLKEHLPLIIAVNIAIGYINIHIHYKYFYNFDIFPYLNASEIATFALLSIGNFSILDLLIVILTTYVLLYHNVQRNGDDSHVSSWLLYLLITLQILKPSSFVLYLEFIEKFEILYSIQEFLIGFMICVAILCTPFYLVYRDRTINIKSDHALVLYVLIATYSTMFFLSFKHGADIANIEKYLGTKVITKDDKYIVSDSVKYIGRTNSYTFFFKTSDSAVVPIANSEIIKQVIKTNIDHTTVLRQNPF